jgi:hypothetical protein
MENFECEAERTINECSACLIVQHATDRRVPSSCSLVLSVLKTVADIMFNICRFIYVCNILVSAAKPISLAADL